MSSPNRWKKYFQEAIGEDLRREDEPMMTLSQVAKLRDINPVEAISSVFLGPLAVLYATSPSFKKEVDVATQILPNIEGLVLSPRNIETIKQSVLSNLPKFADSATLNAQTALAFIKAKYPRLASLVRRYRYRDIPEVLGRYVPDADAVVVSIANPDRSVRDFAGTIMHELIHALQNRRSKYLKMTHEEYVNTVKALKDALKKGDITFDEFYKAYYEIPVEAQAERASETAKRAFEKYLELIRQSAER